MYRLVYYSANRISGTSEEVTTEIEQILAASRRNNAKVGITGALMVSEGFFGQVLEGPQAAIEATFERIQQDARHGEVSLLDYKEVAAKAFDSWDMAYVGHPSSDIFASFERHNSVDEEKLKGDKLFRRLRELVVD